MCVSVYVWVCVGGCGCVCVGVCVYVCVGVKSNSQSSAVFMLLYDWCLATVFSVHSTSAFRVDVDSNVARRSPGVVAGVAALANAALAKQMLIVCKRCSGLQTHSPPLVSTKH